MNRAKRRLFQLLTLAGSIVVLELGAAGVTVLLWHQGWMPRLQAVTPVMLEDYLAHRNPILGWGPSVDASGQVLVLSGRTAPQAADGATCVSAYGDSFTFGSDVLDDQTYPHQLGLRLGCRVANYGVGGYGSDQAFMRYRAQLGLDQAPTVILAHVSENILRNVNQYRALLYPGPGQELSFKPVFTLAGANLTHVPPTVATADDYAAVARDAGSQLPLDAFRTRPRREFPYLIALARWGAADFHVRAFIGGLPRHVPFYQADHPSRALALTSTILRTFASEATARGQRALVLLIPVGPDFAYHQRTGTWPDEPLYRSLSDAGVEVLHGGRALRARLGPADPCVLYADCHGHFNARGYEWLAASLDEFWRMSSGRIERGH